MRAVWLALLILAAALDASVGAQPMSDAEIREAMVAASIASYRGACPCPYNVMRNGRRCGANSAYGKPGGAAPLCFPQDVTPAMVAAYRAQFGRSSR